MKIVINILIGLFIPIFAIISFYTSLLVLLIYLLMVIIYLISIILLRVSIKRGWVVMGARTNVLKAKFKKSKIGHRKASKTLKSSINSKQKHSLKRDLHDAKLELSAVKSVKADNKVNKQKDKIKKLID